MLSQTRVPSQPQLNVPPAPREVEDGCVDSSVKRLRIWGSGKPRVRGHLPRRGGAGTQDGSVWLRSFHTAMPAVGPLAPEGRGSLLSVLVGVGSLGGELKEALELWGDGALALCLLGSHEPDPQDGEGLPRSHSKLG